MFSLFLLPLALFALYPVPVSLAFAEFNYPFDQFENKHLKINPVSYSLKFHLLGPPHSHAGVRLGGHKIEVTPGHMIELQTAPSIIRPPPDDAEAAAEPLNFIVFLQFGGCPCVTWLRCARRFFD